MKRTMMLMALAAFSAPTWGAAWESALQPSLYSVTFAGYGLGEKLSDAGAVGGAWQTVPALAMARAAEIGDRTGPSMEFATQSNNDVAFGVANVGGAGAKAFRASMFFTSYETAFADLPALNASQDKFALALWTPEGGTPTFVGWSATGWRKLHFKSGTKPESHRWYDLSVWLVTGMGGQVRAQYRVKVGDDYEPLLAEDDSAWVNAGGGVRADSIVRGVAFRGEGAFDALAGRELPSTGITVHFR